MHFSTSTLLAMMAAILASSTTALPTTAAEDAFHLSLLKRQEPGTPLYDCHLACGTAVQLGREPDYCTLVPFLVNYGSCLNCAGPNNFNIWQYYGTTLTARGSACGLDTVPL